MATAERPDNVLPSHLQTKNNLSPPEQSRGMNPRGVNSVCGQGSGWQEPARPTGHALLPGTTFVSWPQKGIPEALTPFVISTNSCKIYSPLKLHKSRQPLHSQVKGFWSGYLLVRAQTWAHTDRRFSQLFCMVSHQKLGRWSSKRTIFSWSLLHKAKSKRC